VDSVLDQSTVRTMVKPKRRETTGTPK